MWALLKNNLYQLDLLFDENIKTSLAAILKVMKMNYFKNCKIRL